MRDEDYFAIKDRAADLFLKIPHVNAVGIGSRERNGRPTGEPSIKVFVTRKKPEREVPPEELIPASFEGLPTDVVEMAPAIRRSVDGVTHPGGMIADLTDLDPLRGGVSISLEGKKGLGTLGCILRDKQDGSAIYALANYHVVAKDNKLSRSRRVAHPSTRGPDFEFEFDEANTKGIVAEGTLDALRDAAVFRLDQGVHWIPFVEGIGYLQGWRDVSVTQAAAGTFQVRKRGTKTLLTGGVVTAIADMEIEKLRHKNLLIIRPNHPDPPGSDTWFFADEGDSGSVVVNDQNEVVGLYFAFVDPGVHPTPQDGYGFAFRIGTILERFRTVDGLDLEVARPTNAGATDPNDPVEQQTVPFPAGVPAMTAPDQVRLGDHQYYRPLVGGAQILAEPMGEPNATSLGCILIDIDNDDRPTGAAYILTSYTGVSRNGTVPPTSDTKVGQPDHEHSISGCCSNIVAAFTSAAPNPTPTAAIVKLKDDQKWLAEIMRIGLVAGSYTVTASDVVDRGPYTVWKCGAWSRLTSGVVVRIPGMTTPPPTGVPRDAMLIRPHDDPLKRNDEVNFSRYGDRGAVLVNTYNEVVGVLYDEIDIPDTNGRHVFHGLATPIETLLNELKTEANVKLIVASAKEVGIVQTPRVSRLKALPMSLPSTPYPHRQNRRRRPMYCRRRCCNRVAGRPLSRHGADIRAS
jgi:hypothetical protein